MNETQNKKRLMRAAKEYVDMMRISRKAQEFSYYPRGIELVWDNQAGGFDTREIGETDETDFTGFVTIPEARQGVYNWLRGRDFYDTPKGDKWLNS